MQTFDNIEILANTSECKSQLSDNGLMIRNHVIKKWRMYGVSIMWQRNKIRKLHTHDMTLRYNNFNISLVSFTTEEFRRQNPPQSATEKANVRY
jgi:hypothetical protein